MIEWIFAILALVLFLYIVREMKCTPKVRQKSKILEVHFHGKIQL